MSAPAAKAFSLPVSTMAPVVESLSKARRAALSSVKRAVERALRARGRWRVTIWDWDQRGQRGLWARGGGYSDVAY